MKLHKELHHLLFLAKNGGVKKLMDHLYENILFDLKNGTNTSAWLEKNDFKHHPENFEHGIRYRASATNEVVDALSEALKHIDPAEAGYCKQPRINGIFLRPFIIER